MATHPPARAARVRLPGAVILLGLTSFFTDIGSEMIFPLLPVFVTSLGASTAFLGLLEGVADATASLLKLGSGYWVDRTVRKKPLVLVGYGLAALARPLMALAVAPWHVLAVRLTDRVGKGLRTSPRDVLIAAATPAHAAGRAFGFHRAMDHAGAVVGPLVATLLLSLGLELRMVFAAALVPGLFSLVALVAVREPPDPPPLVKSHLEPNHLPPRLKSYLAIVFLFALGNSSDAFLLLRARELGVSVALLPVLWTVLHVSKMLSTYLGGGLADRVARAKLNLGGWLTFAVTYLALAAASETWHAWALFVFYGAYYGLTEPVEKALVSDLAPPALRGRAFGFYHFIVGASAVPAGLVTGWLWQAFSAQVALSTGAGLAAAASIALWVWRRG